MSAAANTSTLRVACQDDRPSADSVITTLGAAAAGGPSPSGPRASRHRSGCSRDEALRLQELLLNTTDYSRRIDIRPGPTVAEEEAAVDKLLPAVGDAMQRALQTLEEVAAVYGGHDEEADASAPSSTDDADPFAELFDALADGDPVADVAFLARRRLEEKLTELLSQAQGHESWKVLGHCHDCLRSLRKALRAVERLICQREGLETRITFSSDLELSIEVRRIYGQLHSELMEIATRLPDQVAQVLRSAGVSLAKVLGSDLYDDLRVTDRVPLLNLQNKIVAWLRDEEGEDREGGLRLWQDLIGTAELLQQVNNRQDLVEHDQDVMAHVLDVIDAAADADLEIPRELMSRLLTLEGRDSELDQLLHQQPPPAARDLRAKLRQMNDTPHPRSW